MALFGKLFGKNKETAKKKDVEKEISCMIVIPKNEEEADNYALLEERLKASKTITLKDSIIDNGWKLKIASGEMECDVNISTMEVEIPEMFRIQHFFRDIDIEAIQRQKRGLVVEMLFNERILDSYHTQLKLIHEMMPDCLAVLDASSEKVLSGKWVALAAESNVPPSPRYIFTVQAVSNDDDEVWLHSHGLNRCGLCELEVLNSTKDTYDAHYNIIETMAKRLIEKGELLSEKEPIYLAMVTNEIPLIAVAVDWKEALKKYPSGILGGAGDRKEGHNRNTDVIFCYATPEDYDKKRYSEVSVFDEYLSENPIYMLSNQETERMKKLAAERLEYMLKMFGRENIHILLKVGLEVDEEFKEEGNSFEHIWFELKKKESDTFEAELTQEPYYVKDLHEGAVMTFPYSQITDWIIFTQDGRVTPDDVYLLAYDGWNLE
ncbi:MAG: DUF4026 domain-containing protein [Lachnospiraceae bacterium]|nr:DUF4026 domain-containing protein [Lachnospiraceae bacterium]